MFKKISFLLVIILIFTSIVVSAQENIKVIVDDNEVVFDQPPIIVDGRTMVPLRKIFEALGAYVDWDEQNQTVFAKKRLTNLSFKINDKIMFKDGQKVALDVPAQIINNRTLIPVRAVAEGLGASVDWNEDAQTVKIKSKQGEHFISDKREEKVIKSDDTVLIGASITYPEIRNTDNDSGIEKINIYNKTVKDDFINFINTYDLEEIKTYLKENPNNFHSYVYDSTFDIGYDKNNYISILYYVYEDTGGAHPGSMKVSKTFDAKTGEPITLTDIFNGSEKEIKDLIIKKFVDMIDKQPEYYYENAKEIVENQIDNVEFYLTEDGVDLFFQPYDIAAYAAGYPTIKIPYTEKVFKADLK